MIFQNVMLYSLVMGTNIMEKPAVSINVRGVFYSEDGGSRFLPNTATHLPNYTV
jgi:hypothetical protein